MARELSGMIPPCLSAQVPRCLSFECPKALVQALRDWETRLSVEASSLSAKQPECWAPKGRVWVLTVKWPSVEAKRRMTKFNNRAPSNTKFSSGKCWFRGLTEAYVKHTKVGASLYTPQITTTLNLLINDQIKAIPTFIAWLEMLAVDHQWSVIFVLVIMDLLLTFNCYKLDH